MIDHPPQTALRLLIMNQEPEILFEKRGTAGLVTLNRPKALNAVNLSMTRALHNQLRVWANDSTITRVIITGAGDRAFCAGGDLRHLYELGKQERFVEVQQFFREEFQLVYAIKAFPKPYISLMDGIVMGGGFGLSAHGSHRVACDKYVFAMPEVGIGFFPDVGATHILPRLTGYIGEYIALTGEKIGSYDALDAGLVTHIVRSSSINDIIAELADNNNIEYVLDRFSAPHKKSQLHENKDIIQACFSQTKLLGLIALLDQHADKGSEFARKTAAAMRSKSPSSLAITHEQMRRGHNLDLNAALKLEFRIVARITQAADFFEGIRAAIIEKDQKPVWTPARIEDISQTDIESYFAPLPNNELTFL